MKLVIVLVLLTSACAMRLDFTPPTGVAVGELLRIRCLTAENGSSVWALRFFFRNASNSFEILRRLDGAQAILLDTDGHPSRFESLIRYRDFEINVTHRGLQLKIRVNMATSGAKVTCKELPFGDSEGESQTRSIDVSRRPSVVLIQVQPDSSSKKAARITSVPAGSRLMLECRADLGSPPVSRNDLSLQIGHSSRLPTLIAQCKKGVEPSQLRCIWTINTGRSMNRSSVACVVRDKRKNKYRSEETKLLIYEELVSLEMEVAIYACDQAEDYQETIGVRAQPKVKDVLAQLIELAQRKLRNCSVKNWRLRRNIGHYKKTGEKVIQMKKEFRTVYVNLNGTVVTNDLKDIRDLISHHLKPSDTFFYVKDFINVVSMFRDN